MAVSSQYEPNHQQGEFFLSVVDSKIEDILTKDFLDVSSSSLVRLCRFRDPLDSSQFLTPRVYKLPFNEQ
jgi:hypothetical protein